MGRRRLCGLGSHPSSCHCCPVTPCCSPFPLNTPPPPRPAPSLKASQRERVSTHRPVGQGTARHSAKAWVLSLDTLPPGLYRWLLVKRLWKGSCQAKAMRLQTDFVLGLWLGKSSPRVDSHTTDLGLHQQLQESLFFLKDKPLPATQCPLSGKLNITLSFKELLFLFWLLQMACGILVP